MYLPQTPGLWLLALALVVAGLRLAQLWWRDRARGPEREQVRARLTAVAQGAAQLPAGWRRRPLPETVTDRRLIVAHEDAARQRLVRFPGEEAARTVLFGDGRVELFTESAFERLLVGDNVLRGRLDLPAIDIDGNEEAP